MTKGIWALIIFLAAMLAGAGYLAYVGWTWDESGEPVPMSIHGYIALVLGVVFSLVVGVGLMGLVFYSSRKGYDEPPELRK